MIAAPEILPADEAMAEAPANSLRPIPHADAAVGAGEGLAHGITADAKSLADLLRAVALPHLAEQLPLTVGEIPELDHPLAPGEIHA